MIRDQIIEEFASYYQRALRDIAWALREMTKSDDLDALAEEVKGISVEMHKSAKSWRYAYEKPGPGGEHEGG